jgi:import inner membrane translocase subunit TIM50
VSHRLFRECLTYKNGSLVKDLDRLNRDLSRVLIIDHNKEAFGLHPDNAVLVKKWNDSSSEDAELLQLLPLLETVVKDDVRDVREIIRAFGNENTAIKFKEHLNTLRAQVQEEENEAKSSSWFGGLRASQRRTTAK